MKVQFFKKGYDERGWLPVTVDILEKQAQGLSDNERETAIKQIRGELESEGIYGIAQQNKCLELLKSETEKHGVFPVNEHNAYRGAVISLRNGSYLFDKDLKITGKDGMERHFQALGIYCYVDDTIYDNVNGFTGMNLYEYIEMLRKDNPKLKMDLSLFKGTPWSDDSTALFNRLLR